MLIVACTMTSCRGMVEKARRDIAFEGIERVQLQGLSGVELGVKVKNMTRHKLVLKEMEFEVFLEGRSLVRGILSDRVEVEKRSHGVVVLPWRLSVSNPMALWVMLRKIPRRDFSKITVSYRLKGRGGLVPIKISRENAPISEFLNNFGVSANDAFKFIK